MSIGNQERARPQLAASVVARAANAALAAAILGTALVALPAGGAVSTGGPTSGGGGFSWGVGVGATCHDVIERIRRNWMDVRDVVAPNSTAMRPRARGFYCVSPEYTRESLPKTVPLTTGLQCFEIQGKGFCCDRRLRQCATM